MVCPTQQKHALKLPRAREQELGRFLWGTIRDPLPDTINWATERTDRYNRRSWVVIEELEEPGDSTSVDRDGLLPRLGSRIQLRGPTTTPLPWGRVESVREGQRIRVTTTGVKRLHLLLSPAEIDFSKPVRIELDGRVVSDQVLEPSLATLLRWAALDDDRSLLFAAELELQPSP